MLDSVHDKTTNGMEPESGGVNMTKLFSGLLGENPIIAISTLARWLDPAVLVLVILLFLIILEF